MQLHWVFHIYGTLGKLVFHIFTNLAYISQNEFQKKHGHFHSQILRILTPRFGSRNKAWLQQIRDLGPEKQQLTAEKWCLEEDPFLHGNDKCSPFLFRGHLFVFGVYLDEMYLLVSVLGGFFLPLVSYKNLDQLGSTFRILSHILRHSHFHCLYIYIYIHLENPRAPPQCHRPQRK